VRTDSERTKKEKEKIVVEASCATSSESRKNNIFSRLRRLKTDYFEKYFFDPKTALNPGNSIFDVGS
jgi:hypothetical protein